MPTFLIALASALLLAALVTEATQRFFPNSYIALLVITSIALLINGLFNARLRQTSKTDNKAGNAQPREANRSRGENRNRSDNKASDRGDSRKRGDNRGRGDNRNRGQDQKQGGDRNKRGGNGDKREAPKPSRGPKATPDTPSEQPKPAAADAAEAHSEDSAPRGPQESGEVKWFNRTKGYGFIIRENGDEIFVHQRSIIREGDNGSRPVLRDGQKVTFVVAHLEKGAQAEQVKGID